MIDLARTDRLTLRIDEFCEVFSISRRTAYYWISTRRVRAIRAAFTGSFRIPVDEARRLLAMSAVDDVAQTAQNPSPDPLDGLQSKMH